MKILVVAPQPFYEERGTPIATRRLVETLCVQGHQVDLLTYPVGRDLSLNPARVFRSMQLPGIKKVAVGFSWQKLALDIPLSIALARRAKRGAYDVVHAVEEAVFPALMLRWRHGAKVVYDMDSNLATELLASHSEFRLFKRQIISLGRWAMRRSDLVLAVCDELSELAREVAVAPESVHVLHDTPVEAAPSDAETDNIRTIWPEVTTVALYVGNLLSYQGIDLLLDAATELDANSRVGIVVIGGDDDDINFYRKQVSERGLDGRIRFIGRRPLGDLPAYLKQADVLLSPRITGGNTPLKIYSYMAAGKAILATRLSTHTQVLDSNTARLFDPQAKEMAGALNDLASDASMRQRLGDAARALVDAKYSVRAYQESLDNAYQHLL